jgi:hypothetical protein
MTFTNLLIRIVLVVIAKITQILIALFFLSCCQAKAQADTCHKWFSDHKLSDSKDCLIKCATRIVDMATFSCPNRCAEFCKSSYPDKAIFEMSYLYLGLTPAERALAAKFPKEALIVYTKALEAEDLCSNKYESVLTGDIGDACRHFVWAVLLYHSIGSEKAQSFLDAHEEDPTQNETDRSMDLANNRLGLLQATKVKKANAEHGINSIALFQEQVANKAVIILKDKVKK